MTSLIRHLSPHAEFAERRQHYYDDIWQGIAFEYWPDREEINTLIVHQPSVGVIVDPSGEPEEDKEDKED